MANIIRVKRSTGSSNPSQLANAEVAVREGDEVLIYGKGSGGAGGSATSIIEIGGKGAFVALAHAQTISGNKTFTGTVDLSGATVPSFTCNQNLTVTGNLTVNGTTTTVNSTTVSLDDKNLELGSTSSPSDAGASGGGITLKGTSDKTFNWIDSTDSWTSSEHIELAANKVLRIDGVSVLSKTTLGSTVTGSSLTSVATITSGVWNGTTIALSSGGTGATTAAGARSAIGAQPLDSDLTNLSGCQSGASNAISLLTQAEVEILDGATLSTTELNYVDGVTSAIQTQLNNKQPLDADLTSLAGCQSGAAAAIALLTQAEVEILDGLTATTTQLNRVDATSSIQTQLDNKQASNSKLTELATMGANTASALADLTQIEVEILDGATLSTTELNYVDGVTSAIQTQLDTKLDANSTINGGSF